MNRILEELTNRTDYRSPKIIAITNLVQSKNTFIRNDIVVSGGGGVYN